MQAYLDCFSGISGDMTLGAMVDLGVPVGWLERELGLMPLEGFDISVRQVMRHGISAALVEVVAEENHHHRRYSHIRAMIDGSSYSMRVKERSLAVFGRLAAAESVIHNVPEEEVHFHEVGGLDAIVDIVGSCLALEYMSVDLITASPLPLGSGFVECRHGTLPIPVPATVEILKGVPVYAGNVACEMVTPTGAAIATALASFFGPLPKMRFEKIGYGAGSREFDTQPNLLRVMLGEPAQQAAGLTIENLVMVECCIDDMNPELYGYLMERLFGRGALDVFWVPVNMKKNRPGTMIKVLCESRRRDDIVECIFLESTTLGVRVYEVQRWALAREEFSIPTQWGDVSAKKVVGIDGSERVIPEFEACRRIADCHGLPLRSVYDKVLLAYHDGTQ